MAELTISADEIAQALRRNVADFTPGISTEQVGRILEVFDGIARVSGLPNAAVNELLEFECGELGLALNLDEDRQQELSNALRRVVGYDVQLRVSVDPSILGGFVATIGDTVVDASVRHQLEVLRDRLVMPEANITLGGSS